METTETDTQANVDRVYAFAANQLVNEKKSPEETKKLLVENGLDEESANVVITKLQEEIITAKKDNGHKDMLVGALWCVGGIVVTAVTYSAASGGGTYVVAYGAIIFGAIQFFRGLINSNGG
jgi:hypothetical protein